MKLVCISDTHGKHDSINLPDGDVLIHAGDFCNIGSESDFYKFYQWFLRQPHKHKIFVAGNHDWHCYKNHIYKYDSGARVYYLEDSEVTINGRTFYGSPWQPEFCSWAFNLPSFRLKKVWKNIPDYTNVLITHCPQQGELDAAGNKKDLGCPHLTTRVNELIKNNSYFTHICGHIHDSYGIIAADKHTFINASICDERYDPVNAPIVIEI
jgi:Icc-related predicted phosphoesterase